jgi:YtkA-like
MKALLLLFLFLAQSVMAQKTDAKLDCRHTGKDFIYDCTIKLERGGEPLAGVQLTIGADMPSMPMAHNVKPVKGQPTKTPGEYRARLDLEMSGEWAVKLRLAGPVRDQLIVHYHFTESGKPPRR